MDTIVPSINILGQYMGTIRPSTDTIWPSKDTIGPYMGTKANSWTQ